MTPPFNPSAASGGFDLGPKIEMPPIAAAVKAKPKFFAKDGAWRDVVGIMADALSAGTGNQPVYMPMKLRRMEMEREEAREERKLNRPQFENVPGVGVVAINPTDMSATTVAASKSPGQVYAESQGLQPGTAEYNSALADYALRGSGPTAFGYKGELQDDRQEAAMQALQENIELRRQIAQWSNATSRENNIRSTGTSAANNIRSTGTSAANNIRSTDTSRENSIRSNQTSRANAGLRADVTRGGAAYQGRGGRGRGNTARIVNPQTGQAMVLKNGKWVPER